MWSSEPERCEQGSRIPPLARPTALSLTVRRGFCKEREEESGKLKLPSFPEIIIIMSDNQTERETCGETRKGFSVARTKKTVEPTGALLSPPLPQLSGAHSATAPSPQPSFCNTSRRSKGQRPQKSGKTRVVVGPVMSGHERRGRIWGFHK